MHEQICPQITNSAALQVLMHELNPPAPPPTPSLNFLLEPKHLYLYPHQSYQRICHTPSDFCLVPLWICWGLMHKLGNLIITGQAYQRGMCSQAATRFHLT